MHGNADQVTSDYRAACAHAGRVYTREQERVFRVRQAVAARLGLPGGGAGDFGDDVNVILHEARYFDCLADDPALVRQARALFGLYMGLGDPLTAVACRFWCSMRDDPEARQFLAQRLGLSYPAIADRFIGVARGVCEGERQISFPELEPGDGVPVITLPVMGPGHLPGVTRAIDLVACPVSAPRQWRSVTGLADVLCFDQVSFCRMGSAWTYGGRVRLFSSVVSWLAAGVPRGSYVVLDWHSQAARDLLARIDRGSVAVVVDDLAAAEALKKAARPRRPALQVEVAA